MSYDLCLTHQAKRPYYIQTIRTGIYSLEELCYYLYHNMYLIDESVRSSRLCTWIREELGLGRLAKVLSEHVSEKDSAVPFVMLIFREIGYLTAQEGKLFQDQLTRYEGQQPEIRRKLRGDYLVKCGMYGSAILEYQRLLDQKRPGKLGVQFYAGIWNNMGTAYAGLFEYERASECFYESWSMTRTKETFRKYVSTLPLFLTAEEYQKKLEELNADKILIRNIQEYNAKLCAQSGAGKRVAEIPEEKLATYVQYLRDEYCRSMRL